MVMAQVVLGSFCMTLPAYAEERGTRSDHDHHHEEMMEPAMTPLQPMSTAECDGCATVAPKHPSIGFEEAAPCGEGHCLSAGFSLTMNLTKKIQDGERQVMAWQHSEPPSSITSEDVATSVLPPFDRRTLVLDVRRE